MIVVHRTEQIGIFPVLTGIDFCPKAPVDGEAFAGLFVFRFEIAQEHLIRRDASADQDLSRVERNLQSSNAKWSI